MTGDQYHSQADSSMYHNYEFVGRSWINGAPATSSKDAGLRSFTKRPRGRCKTPELHGACPQLSSIHILSDTWGSRNWQNCLAFLFSPRGGGGDFFWIVLSSPSLPACFTGWHGSQPNLYFGRGLERNQCLHPESIVEANACQMHFVYI